ncbi:PREDICTED: uncharacterized protein LOC104774082 [Camelina sativa]|uniref:ATP-dependent DNA helicase n=1 Tax=Camelina sativa TaxID=90675 RepID=A0ABM0Y864_CAMSA|nr:PREDICTED: uncharacterized protein LOC104774082 [Camelina sativa]
MLKEASLIIWDEAPMMSRYCFENLDRSLSDIMRNADNKPFGGNVVVFGGDFRHVLSLTKNMRLMSKNMTEIEARNIKEFSDWILAVGDGKIPETNDGEALIDIPEELLITDVVDPIDSISRAVYGDLEKLHTKTDPKFFQTRAILCPTNSDVNTINERLLEKLQEMMYLSADSIDPQDSESINNPVFSSDFLNSIKLSGLPDHSLRLKIGAFVMLLRNIDPKGGLCNGTRLQITQMGINVLEACVITGERVGEKVLIPKSQGQSLEEVGLFLPRPVFSHGQLYVALSRVTSKKGLKVLILDKDGGTTKQTMNVVFKENFQNIWK